jgi:sugar phosphate isomerase/epimerase
LDSKASAMYVQKPSRRRFLHDVVRATVAVSAVVATGGDSIAGDADAPKQTPNHCVFTKPLTSMSPETQAKRLAEMGFGGIECPIRAGGQIEPDRVVDELPALVETLAGHDISILIMTSDINDPEDPLTETQLRTAATLGIPSYRMQYYRYEKGKDLPSQIDRWRGQMKDLAAMNHEFGIQGLYQNHAGYRMFGGQIWDLYQGISDIDPDHLGVAYDLRHAAVESGMGWQMGWELIQEHVRALCVKDFKWRGPEVIHVPLGEGIASSDFYRQLSEPLQKMTISLHEEYHDHRRPDLVETHLQSIAKDYATLRRWLDEGNKT